MTKLSDTQRILLANAAQRDSGSLRPFPDTLADGARAAKAIAGLATRSLIEEPEASDPAAVHRIDGDLRFGMFINTAGMAAINVGEGSGTEDSAPPPRPCPEARTRLQSRNRDRAAPARERRARVPKFRWRPAE